MFDHAALLDLPLAQQNGLYLRWPFAPLTDHLLQSNDCPGEDWVFGLSARFECCKETFKVEGKGRDRVETRPVISLANKKSREIERFGPISRDSRERFERL